MAFSVEKLLGNDKHKLIRGSDETLTDGGISRENSNVVLTPVIHENSALTEGGLKGTVRVRLLRGENVRPKSHSGELHPRVAIQLGTQTWQSTPAWGSNPLWHGGITVCDEQDFQVTSEDATLNIKVLDQPEATFMNPTVIGGHSMNVSTIVPFSTPTERSLKIISPGGQQVGEMMVELSWIAPPDMAEARSVDFSGAEVAAQEPRKIVRKERSHDVPKKPHAPPWEQHDTDTSTEIFLNVYNLLPFKSGIYHSGIQIKNQEFNYGFLDEPMTGVYRTRPREAPFHYRETLHLGTAPYPFEECKKKLMDLRPKWWGIDYDLLNNNCNDFTNGAAKELLGFGIPTWVNSPARTLGKTEEARRVSKIPCQDPDLHYSKVFPHLKDAAKVGYLAKQGAGGSLQSDNWKRRWFVLAGNFLWYLDEEYSDSILGCIPLLGTKLKHSSEGTDSFEISHPVHRSFQISAYGPEDRGSGLQPFTMSQMISCLWILVLRIEPLCYIFVKTGQNL